MSCSAAMRRTTGEIGGLCSSPCASPGTPPVSIVASTVPTSTVAPTSTSSDTTRPVAGDGTSVSTLSVEISTIGSSDSIQSPTRFFHSTTVPSATDTPICGIVTSTAVLIGEELTASLLHGVDLGERRALERRAERDRLVRRRNADDRAVEVLERVLADARRHLGPHAARAGGLVQNHDLARLADRGEDRVDVQRIHRPQVEHLDRCAVDVVRGL